MHRYQMDSVQEESIELKEKEIQNRQLMRSCQPISKLEPVSNAYFVSHTTWFLMSSIHFYCISSLTDDFFFIFSRCMGFQFSENTSINKLDMDTI